MEISIVQYKDAYSVNIGERMLIYGLTFNEARDFRSMYYLKAPNEQFTPARSTRMARVVDGESGGVKKRGRKLVLEAYLPTIRAYLDKSAQPTIKELDDILLKEGASYSSTTSIKNVLHSIGREIPWKAPVVARLAA